MQTMSSSTEVQVENKRPLGFDIYFSSSSKAMKTSCSVSSASSSSASMISTTDRERKTITSNSPKCKCNNYNIAQSSSSFNVNRTFASVYIDKDEDYLTRQNSSFAPFSVSQDRFNDCSNSSEKLKPRTGHSSFKNVRAISRKKFYKWAWASTGDVATSRMQKYQKSSPQQIARRLGVVRR